jgi:hypothetical protein
MPKVFKDVHLSCNIDDHWTRKEISLWNIAGDFNEFLV